MRLTSGAAVGGRPRCLPIPVAVPLAICALAFAFAAAGCARTGARELTLATTTSVGNSGLLDLLLPAFAAGYGVSVHAHLVGSGRALALLGNGSADVVISHAPDAEAAALEAHAGWAYRKIMFNDFVIAGPAEDPARVASASTVSDAMRRIALSTERFISRGDESGTHERERALWKQAGVAADRERLVVAGAGMGTTLRVASETGAYTLTDRATFAQHAASLRLRVVFEGGPELLNTYAVVIDPGGPRAADARAFAEWLASGGGRDVIERYRVGADVPAFVPWPSGRAAAHPRDLPR